MDNQKLSGLILFDKGPSKVIYERDKIEIKKNVLETIHNTYK